MTPAAPITPNPPGRASHIPNPYPTPGSPDQGEAVGEEPSQAYIDSPITYIPYYRRLVPTYEYNKLEKEVVETVRLYRSGFYLEDIGVRLRRYRHTVERWLCHVLRVCVPGTLDDSDTRDFLPQIRWGWVIENYWPVIVRESRRVGLPVEDCWEARLERIRREDRLARREAKGLVNAATPPSPLQNPRHSQLRPRKYNNNRVPKAQRDNPWGPVSISLADAINVEPKKHIKCRIADFKSGMTFNAIAVERGIARATLQTHIFTGLMWSGWDDDYLERDEVKRLADEMKGVDKHPFYWHCMKKWCPLVGLSLSDIEDDTVLSDSESEDEDEESEEGEEQEVQGEGEKRDEEEERGEGEEEEEEEGEEDKLRIVDVGDLSRGNGGEAEVEAELVAKEESSQGWGETGGEETVQASKPRGTGKRSRSLSDLGLRPLPHRRG